MKKLIYSLLFCTALIGMFSACDDNNEVFDRSAAERLKDAQDKALNVLKAAQNGWVMQYYSDTASYGGYTLWAKFGDRNVTVAGENIIVGSHEEVTSQYTMKGDRGPVLSFSTYNKLFHLFSDPQSDGVGMNGDYEFMVLEAESDHMVLQGKKRGTLIRMTPLPADETYDSYLTKIDQMNENLVNASPFKWEILLGDDASDPTNVMQIKINKGRNMNITYTYVLNKDNCSIEALWGTTESDETYVPYIITTDGLQFYNPRQVGKALLTGFKWDAEKEHFVADGQELNPVKLSPLHLFQVSEDSWVIDAEEGKLGSDVKEAWDALEKVMMEKLSSTMYFVGLTYIPSLGNVIYFPGLTGEQGFLVLDYKLTEPNRIAISLADSQYSQAGVDMFINVPEFRAFLNALCASAMLLEADNDVNPNSIALRKTRGTKEVRFTFKKAGGSTLFTWPETEEKKEN